jgi:HSP20 family protein
VTNQPETPKEVATRPRVLGLSDLRDEMDRLWETLMPSPWRPFRFIGRQQLSPALDVYEKDGKLHVRAELPGISAKDVEVEISNEALTISGEKKEEREVKEENYYRAERSYGKFRRQVALPPGADAAHVEARFRDGVLEVEIPVKPAETGAKKVEVKAGG